MEKIKFQIDDTKQDSGQDFIDVMAQELKQRMQNLQVNATINESYQEEYQKLKHKFTAAIHQLEISRREAEEKNVEIQASAEKLMKLQKSFDLSQAEKHEFKKAIQNYSQENKKLKSEQEQLEEEIVTLKGRISALQVSLTQDTENWRRQALDLRTALTSLEQKSREQILSHKDDVQKFTEKTTQLEAKISSYEALVENLESKLDVYETEKNESLKKLSELTLQMSELSTAYSNSQLEYRKVTSENSRLQRDVSETRRSLHESAQKLTYLQNVRRRARSFYKTLVQNLRHENADLNAKVASLTEAQSEMKAELSLSDESFKSQMLKLKSDFESRLAAMTKDYQSQLDETHQQLDQERNFVDQLKQMHRKQIGEFQEKYRTEAQNREAVEREAAHLQVRLEEQKHENEKQYSEMKALSQKNQEIQAKFENDLLQFTRVNAELRRSNLQKVEEIRELRAQLNDRSHQLIRMEIELEELKQKISTQS